MEESETPATKAPQVPQNAPRNENQEKKDDQQGSKQNPAPKFPVNEVPGAGQVQTENGKDRDNEPTPGNEDNRKDRKLDLNRTIVVDGLEREGATERELLKKLKPEIEKVDPEIGSWENVVFLANGGILLFFEREDSANRLAGKRLQTEGATEIKFNYLAKKRREIANQRFEHFRSLQIEL